MKKIICENYAELSQAGAAIIEKQILAKPDSVLGLATGSTPVGLYKILADKYQAGLLDFSQVSTFNLDEYYPISKTNDQSYDYFMRQQLFNHVNINPERIHIPNGEALDPHAECQSYDQKILESGGLDLQLLGIGQNGHIGFNEPDERLFLAAHLTELTDSTIQANSRFFTDPGLVPRQAVTMGFGSIFAAKKLLLLISGEAKAHVTKELFSGKLSTQIPATLLALHPDVTVVIDKEAASLLPSSPASA